MNEADCEREDTLRPPSERWRREVEGGFYHPEFDGRPRTWDEHFRDPLLDRLFEVHKAPRR